MIDATAQRHTTNKEVRTPGYTSLPACYAPNSTHLLPLGILPVPVVYLASSCMQGYPDDT